MNHSFWLLGMTGLAMHCVHGSEIPPRTGVIVAPFQDGQPVTVDFVNSVVGWDAFFNSGFRGGSSTIGMLEAGTAWFDHEVFERPAGAPVGFTVWNNPAVDAANETDYHATMVAHVLAGSGYIPANGGAFTFVGLGMAPEARLVSGGIATGFSSQQVGSFSVGTASLVNGYRDFFRGSQLGEGIDRLDVINSSWGGGGDPAAAGFASLGLDGLALENTAVAHVVSAGNGGNGAVVGFPANGFNNISVGSTGGADFLTPSGFTSGGLADFFNPEENGGTLHSGVRVAVDVAAPGEDFYLAAYLGTSGGLGAGFPQITQDPSPGNQYFIEQSGTSFAAPMVAGGVALMKDLARTGLGVSLETNPEYFDTRVVKSVLMAGATATEGWDNGQNSMNVTTQALDALTGAGMLNLADSAAIYLGETRDVFGGQGGLVGSNGWDITTIDLTQMVVDYEIASQFIDATTLTVALNWFAVRGFDDEMLGQDLAFTNLDLQVWRLGEGGEFSALVGESRTLYNNTEFLRLEALDPGRYAMRVLNNGLVYDLTDSQTQETYALAWSAAVIPEPGVGLFVAVGAFALVTRRKARRA